MTNETDEIDPSHLDLPDGWKNAYDATKTLTPDNRQELLIRTIEALLKEAGRVCVWSIVFIYWVIRYT